MLQLINVGNKSLLDYGTIASRGLMEEIRRLAAQLEGKRVLHLSATAFGGGVAEILYALVPLMRDAGLDAEWRIIRGADEFFAATKTIHNALQGSPQGLTPDQEQVYRRYNEENAQELEDEYNFVIVHDPQPAFMIERFPSSTARWIWRCHIDLSTPNQDVLNFLLPALGRYDAAIFHMNDYVPAAPGLPPSYIWPPAIDPLTPKNMALSSEDAAYIVDQFGIYVERPLLTQVSRFDPWKDPLGVIDAYREVKERFPEVQLALVGSMAHDDPEGWDYYNQTVGYAQGDPDIYILSNLNNIGGVEVNAFQVHSHAVIQKSIKEGFGLTVTEGLWKTRPTVAGRVGGIVRQIQDGETGWLVDYHDVTWIASAISEEDRAVADETIDETARDGSAFRLRLVAHDEVAYDWFYNVVANPMLWFLQHYLWELPHTPAVDHGFKHAWEQGYVRVNEGFAAAVLEELDAEPDAAVLFHDYHLYLAPRLAREEAPDATLSHSVHIPWPQPDYSRILPEEMRHAVPDGLLANDVVGFHSSRWRLAFLRCAVDITGAAGNFSDWTADYRGRRTWVNASPISIDPEEFDELAESPEVLAAEQEIVERRPGRLSVRVDRTDPSKNVVRGFRAFELYLEAHPEIYGKVALLALLDPSRQDIPEYAEYLGAIQREARRVNDRFQSENWLPIDLRIEDNFPRSVAAYKQFDVLFVNALFDGLNLVAKEAPLVNTQDGVVVLSENAGVCEEIGSWTLTINPFDVAAQAEALHEALEMRVDERRGRLDAIGAHVREHDLGRWLASQLEELDRASARVS